MQSRPLLLLAATLAAAGLAPSSGAGAESAVSLTLPRVDGAIPADTYDSAGNRVGGADLRIEHLANGRVVMRSRSGITGSAGADLFAELEPIAGTQRLRPVLERTESHDETGRSLGLMTIDHQRRVATCGAEAGSGKAARRLPLPEEDRVVNVPLNLLFDPLVRGQAKEVRFQVVLCRVAGGRIVNAIARVAATHPDPAGSGDLLEVRYQMDLGPWLTRLAAPFMPQLSFWFEKGAAVSWVGYRIPLFSKGPTVFVVRKGFSPAALTGQPSASR